MMQKMEKTNIDINEEEKKRNKTRSVKEEMNVEKKAGNKTT